MTGCGQGEEVGEGEVKREEARVDERVWRGCGQGVRKEE